MGRRRPLEGIAARAEGALGLPPLPEFEAQEQRPTTDD